MARRKLQMTPPRLRVLAALGDGVASPNVLSEKAGLTLGTTAYHVRALHDAKMLRLVRESRVRGAIEHHYALTDAGREAVKNHLTLAYGAVGGSELERLRALARDVVSPYTGSAAARLRELADEARALL